MTAPLKVCVVTGTRAEYGLLSWIMREIADHRQLTLQVAVTGAHLAPEFGETWREIEADGFAIDARVDMLLASDAPVAVAKSTGLGVIGFAETFERLRPQIVLLLGDRFEILASAAAATLMRIPIAHIHGGEVTLGVIDEQIRHAVSKMAQLHLVAAEPYRKRLIQMGEAPERVFTVGAPGIDNLARLSVMTRDELEQSLGADLQPPLFLVTYHPETLAARPHSAALGQLLAALERFPAARFLITKANADAGGRAINEELEAFAARHRGRATLVASLGQRRYLSALALADVVIGNSSSGLIEAPSAGTPTVNVGDRQKGRLRAPSVIDCTEETTAIGAAIARALDGSFRRVAEQRVNPYGTPGAVAQRIAEILAAAGPGLGVAKEFHDLPLSCTV